MRVSESMFFTARPALSGTRAAEFAEEKYIFFSAERAEKKMMYALVIRKNHSMVIKSIYSSKKVILP